MKRIVPLTIIVVALCFSLLACSSENTGNNNENQQHTTETENSAIGNSNSTSNQSSVARYKLTKVSVPDNGIVNVTPGVEIEEENGTFSTITIRDYIKEQLDDVSYVDNEKINELYDKICENFEAYIELSNNSGDKFELKFGVPDEIFNELTYYLSENYDQPVNNDDFEDKLKSEFKFQKDGSYAIEEPVITFKTSDGETFVGETEEDGKILIGISVFDDNNDNYPSDTQTIVAIPEKDPELSLYDRVKFIFEAV